MNITIFILSISIILLLLKRSKDRGPLVINPATIGAVKRSINFLPWISKSPRPIEGELATYKPKMTMGERLLTILASFCAIVMCVLELIDRIIPLLKG